MVFSANDWSTWNLTFVDAAEIVERGDSGRLRVAIIDRGKIPAERLHPKAAYSRCRPYGVSDRCGLSGAERPLHVPGPTYVCHDERGVTTLLARA